MKQLIVVAIASLLLMGEVVAAEHVGKPKKGRVLKMTSEQIFRFVETAAQNPKLDRKKAERFLQRLLDGKIRIATTPLKTAAAAEGDCYYDGDFDGHQCMDCDPATDLCSCSDCCIGFIKK